MGGCVMEVDYKAIGKRIAARRKELKMTQAKLAIACDASDQYISNIERATSIPSVEMLLRIASALDTTPDEFLLGTLKRDEEWRQTAELLRPLTPYQLNFASKLLRFVAEELE